MVMEAHAHLGWPLSGITRRLNAHPAEVQKLTRFRQGIDDIPRLGVEVLPVDRHVALQAALAVPTIETGGAGQALAAGHDPVVVIPVYPRESCP